MTTPIMNATADEDVPAGSEALIAVADKLRRNDPVELVKGYTELLYAFGSVAVEEDAKRFSHRLEKLALAHEAWRSALEVMATRLLFGRSGDRLSPKVAGAIAATVQTDKTLAELVNLKAGLQLRSRLPYDKAEIDFYVSSDQELTQVQKFRRREVETQEWIEGFAEGDVFYDVGANIGLFTLLAACQPTNLTVVAVEPTFASFHSLAQNLWLNQVSERVIPLQVGLSDVTAIERLNLRRLEAGTAKSVVGDAIDFRNMPFRPVAVFNVPVLRLDDAIAVYNLPIPNHLKIDVDGIEMKVLAGAEATLARPELRSAMIEAASIDMERELETLMGRFGFEVYRKADKTIGSIEEGHTRNNYFRRR